MAKTTERLNLRMTPDERQSIASVAQRLGISENEAMRAAITTMAQRIVKGSRANATDEAAFIMRQAEWQNYIMRVVGGDLSYDEALAACGKAIAMRLKSEADAAQKQAQEATGYAALFGNPAK